MNKEDAKRLIVAEFLKLPAEERTDSAATALAFKCLKNDNDIYHNDYQAIMGWLGKHIEPRR